MTKLCALTRVVRAAEPCPTEECAFWQAGGTDLEPGCAVERLDLHRLGVDVASFLLDVRRQLEATPHR